MRRLALAPLWRTASPAAPIEDKLVKSFWPGEALRLIGLLAFKSRGWLRTHTRIQIAALHLYGLWASWHLKRAAARG